MTVIELGNSHRTTEASAVIVLMVARLNIRPLEILFQGTAFNLSL